MSWGRTDRSPGSHARLPGRAGFLRAEPGSGIWMVFPLKTMAYAPDKGRKHQSAQSPSSLLFARRSSTCFQASGYWPEKEWRMLPARR
jgi:hypothetical protein